MKNTNELVLCRLKEERKNWKNDHPQGFVARPKTNQDGIINYLSWQCQIPGPQETPWEAGTYNLTIQFCEEYPVKPPRCIFRPVLPHPNIYPSGTVCLSILNEQLDWKPTITIKQILEGIYNLLRNPPNVESPAQHEPLKLYKERKKEYESRVRQFAYENRRKCA